jgi:hypothetical protein
MARGPGQLPYRMPCCTDIIARVAVLQSGGKWAAYEVVSSVPRDWQTRHGAQSCACASKAPRSCTGQIIQPSGTSAHPVGAAGPAGRAGGPGAAIRGAAGPPGGAQARHRARRPQARPSFWAMLISFLQSLAPDGAQSDGSTLSAATCQRHQAQQLRWTLHGRDGCECVPVHMLPADGARR